MTLSPPNLERVAERLCEQLDAEIVRPLGSGAHKVVFLIKQNGASLALKVAPVVATLKTRFERETSVLRDSHHEAIAALEYASSHIVSGNEYWVTIEEFLHGGTLRDRIAARPLTISQIRHVGITLASVLVYLHERKLVHRDIKPDNIIFRDDRSPVLTDFGIVRVLGEPSLTHDFMPQGPGTPLYAAPEQLLNEKASIDWRTDQFDLALVLAECLLGRHAFATDRRDPREAIMLVAKRASISDQTMDELARAGLGCLIKALEPWSVQRYRWPVDFAEALSEGK